MYWPICAVVQAIAGARVSDNGGGRTARVVRIWDAVSAGSHIFV